MYEKAQMVETSPSALLVQNPAIENLYLSRVVKLVSFCMTQMPHLASQYEYTALSTISLLQTAIRKSVAWRLFRDDAMLLIDSCKKV